jgi:hypothetical protein
MAPEQEPGPAPAPPEASATSPPRRRGRRGGRGRRGQGRRPAPPQGLEPVQDEEQTQSPPPLEGTAEPVASVPEIGPAEAPPAAPPRPRAIQPASPLAVQQAIEEVNHIIETLRSSLEDMELVLETLELAERQKNADEYEIETLRRGMRHLHGPRPSGESHHRR